MSGVKGRSGGPRENSGGPRPNSGGARPGAGRKPAPAVAAVPVVASRDPLAMLLQIAFGEIEVSQDQLKAAIAAVPYVHAKKGEGGKKEARQEKAEGVANRFASARAPLSVVKGGRAE